MSMDCQGGICRSRWTRQQCVNSQYGSALRGGASLSRKDCIRMATCDKWLGEMGSGSRTLKLECNGIVVWLFELYGLACGKLDQDAHSNW